MKISFDDIAGLRLLSQQIAVPRFASAEETVAYLGAIQAQDYAMSKWAIGLRLPGSTDAQIESALDEGKFFRTHVLRPTWHLVHAGMIEGMLRLTAPRIRNSFLARHKELGLTAALHKKAQAILLKAMQGNQHLSREEIIPLFEKAKIPVNENRLSHILMQAEIDLLICSGKSKGKQRAYALFDERVERHSEFSPEKELEKLAAAFFRSHGPATIADFTWWSGLSPADARSGLAMISDRFEKAEINSATYWFDPKILREKSPADQVFLLPAFDEFIVSYKDRSATLQQTHNKKAISENGLFRPVIVSQGQVIGLWKRTVSVKKVTIEMQTFRAMKKNERLQSEEQAERFAAFLGLKAEISHGLHS